MDFEIMLEAVTEAYKKGMFLKFRLYSMCDLTNETVISDLFHIVDSDDRTLALIVM